MKKHCIRYILLLTVLSILIIKAPGQEVKSARSSLRISNKPETEVKEKTAAEAAEIDTEPPVIEFITPKIYPGTRFYTEEEKLDLIGKVTDQSEISFVSVNSNLRPITKEGIFTMRLSLQTGDNPCRIMTMDSHENLQDLFFMVNYTPPVLSLAERISMDAAYYGLIIGIDKYDHPEIADLENPVKDARQLLSILTSKYNFESNHVKYLPNATRAEIIVALDELAEEMTSDDNLLIYYAGHGWWDDVANNGYWLPRDADKTIKANWFRNSTLVDYLKEIRSKHTLLIADACFGGSIFNTRSAFGNHETAYEKLYELPSRKAMTSGMLTEVPDRSSFTHYLIERLEQNKEPYLSSEELFSSFRHAVINNSDAVPQYGEINNVGDQGGDFIFLKK